MPKPDCFLLYRIGYGTLQPCLSSASELRCYAEFYVGKIPLIRIGGASPEGAVVLKWFYSLSRRKTFVGGKCALPSALHSLRLFLKLFFQYVIFHGVSA